VGERAPTPREGFSLTEGALLAWSLLSLEQFIVISPTSMFLSIEFY